MGRPLLTTMLVAGAVGVLTSGCAGTDNVAAVRWPPKPIDIGLECISRPENCRRQFDTRRFLNMYLVGAGTRARRLGLDIRVVEVNGYAQSHTADEQFNRIDVGVRGGRVTRIVETG
jgi:hypothetical protein